MQVLSTRSQPVNKETVIDSNSKGTPEIPTINIATERPLFQNSEFITYL